jgi:hypothetical protein
MTIGAGSRTSPIALLQSHSGAEVGVDVSASAAVVDAGVSGVGVSRVGVSVGSGVSVGTGVFVGVGDRRGDGRGVLVGIGVGVGVGVKHARPTPETRVVWVTESGAAPSLSSVAVFVSTVRWASPHGTLTLITISPETAGSSVPTSQERVEVVRRVGVIEAPT